MADSPAQDSSERDLPVLEQLQGLLLNMADIDVFLSGLALVSTRVVAGAASCGITVRYDGSLLTVGSSDARAELLDETQYRSTAGPCLQALTSGTVVSVADMDVERRWPDYLASAREMGLRCSLSLPLVVTDAGGVGEPFGAMNVYGFDAPDLFGPGERQRLEVFAAQAAGTLRVAVRHVKDTSLLAQMEESLRSRSVIDQALGIIMAGQSCTAAGAFALLRRQSQNSRRRLRDIAADLVTRTGGQPPDPGRPFDQG